MLLSHSLQFPFDRLQLQQRHQGDLLRLCVKTEAISALEASLIDDKVLIKNALSEPEVVYCLIKLFRDHGAERKYANDTTYVGKLIKKLKVAIKQDSPTTQESKLRRAGQATDQIESPQTSSRKDRSFRIPSGSSRAKQKSDRYAQLARAEAMSISAGSTSILRYPGEDDDDPDLRAVHLPDIVGKPAISVDVKEDSALSNSISQVSIS